MFLLAWSAAIAIYICAAIILVLGSLAVVSLSLPPGRLRSACQLVLALLGLAVCTLLMWK